MQQDLGFRADLIVNNTVLVELKSVEKISPVYKKFVLTYLRLTDFRIGLLLNFGEELLKNGIHRIANEYVEPSSAQEFNKTINSAPPAPLRETS